MNSTEGSPFYRKLKMLGKKVSGEETLSQGTFAAELIKHISNKPDEDYADAKAQRALKYRDQCIFSKYFIEDKDDVILKILMNVFNALKDVFNDEWNNPKSILTKTTGYSGVMQALPELINYGLETNDLRKESFVKVFEKLKRLMENYHLHFVNTDLPSNASGQAKLRNLINNSINLLKSNS